MEIGDKYISATEKILLPLDKRIILTDDCYAIAEFLDLLIKKIEHARLSLT